MSIVATEIESIHGASGGQRIIFYRCQDDQGTWHNYGPVHDYGGDFDAEGFKTTVAQRVAEQLADIEAKQILGG